MRQGRRGNALTGERNENYRKAAVFLATAARDKRFSAVLFASATEGEGTTTAVLNVARELQQSCGLTPLVIELDMRRPVFTRMFSLDPRKSLQAIAAGKISPMDAVQTGPWELPLIAVAPEGLATDRHADPAAVLRRTLDELTSYDMILVDTPAILAQADAMIAGTVIPQLVLVVEAGRTRYEMLDRVKSELFRENIAIVGTILNKHKRFIPGWIYRWLVQ